MKEEQTIESKLTDLIQRYKQRFLDIPLDKSGADELYKWELITDCQGKAGIDIINRIRESNIVDVPRINKVLKDLNVNQSQELENAFNVLSDESVDLKARLAQFKTTMADLCGDRYNVKANDERTAAAFLACVNPQKYTFYKDELYQNYCKYIGVQSKNAGEKYPHYLELLEPLIKAIKQDAELINKFQTETKGLVQSNLLDAQNVLWQMKDIMNKEDNKYSSFKCLLEYFVSHLEWKQNGDTSFIGYKSYIEPLIKAGDFSETGRGHEGWAIQNQIKKWQDYDGNKVCININGGTRNRFINNSCYLNWEHTWINVRPLWDKGNHIDRLFLSKETKSSAKEELTKTIDDLGLFDNIEPNNTLKSFFDEYETMILKHNGILYNKQYMEQLEKHTSILSLKKNIILQGAPGTGKTYNTAALALSICGVKDGDKFIVREEGKESEYVMKFSDHSIVMKKYEELRKAGQIAFCTFHQSMDYEDFVEGIKPKTKDGVVTYDFEDGIFKRLCSNARNITTEKKSSEIDFTKTRIFKMSLGEKGKDDNEVFNYCTENNVIALGWGDHKDFSQCVTRADFKELDPTWGAFALEVFKMWMKNGDVVLISDGTKAVKAIARVVGDYEFCEDASIDMCQFRKVEWLYIGENIPISKLYDKNLSQQSIYGFYYSSKEGKADFNGGLKVDELNKIITGKVNEEVPQNHVLIIDEINRGNVSKIFGDLITLLEPDKRIGGDHPIKVILPYSKEEFGVPSNLYIIGTMNTTDRSVGNIDYAVRRRFAFVTLESKKEVIEEHYKNDEILKNKALALFDAIKSFLEKHKFDMDIEDLMVGHSYFLAKDEKELDLKWRYEIVPLLREYYKDGIIKQDVKADTTIDDFCVGK